MSSSARAFAFNWAGNLDLLLGYTYQSAWSPPSHTVYLEGDGTGSFLPPVTIKDFPSTSYGQSFAIPQRLCQRFPTSAPE